jgi:hypothetical protein
MGSFLHALLSRLKALPSRLKPRRRSKKRSRSEAVSRRRAGLGHVTFVAITGSCGKSTTRNLAAAILERAGPCQHGSTWIAGRLGRVLEQMGPETRFGTISDHAGAGGPRYRRPARDALQVADRVIFVGRNSGSAAKLRTGALSERLFVIPTTYEASAYLHATRTRTNSST